jgi:hypothetical protein
MASRTMAGNRYRATSSRLTRRKPVGAAVPARTGLLSLEPLPDGPLEPDGVDDDSGSAPSESPVPPEEDEDPPPVSLDEEPPELPVEEVPVDAVVVVGDVEPVSDGVDGSATTSLVMSVMAVL